MSKGLTEGLLVASAIVLAACPANAGAISGGAGIDYQSGPLAETYRGALLFVAAETAPGDLTVAAIRYEDTRQGAGLGGFANAGVRVSPTLRLRLLGLRSFGDHGGDAWRFRAGPELWVARDVTLGAYYLRLHDSSPENLHAAGIELSIPISPRLSGQVGSSYGRWSGGATTAQATFAGTWRADAHVQFLCEIDAGRNVTTTSASASSGGGGGIWGGLPIANDLGNGSPGTESRTDTRVTAAAQVGVRFLIP